jgi:hypothetical protein
MDSVDDQKGGQTTIVERTFRMEQSFISYQLPFDGICPIDPGRDRRTTSRLNGYDTPLVATLCFGSVGQGQESQGRGQTQAPIY